MAAWRFLISLFFVVYMTQLWIYHVFVVGFWYWYYGINLCPWNIETTSSSMLHFVTILFNSVYVNLSYQHPHFVASLGLVMKTFQRPTMHNLCACGSWMLYTILIYCISLLLSSYINEAFVPYFFIPWKHVVTSIPIQAPKQVITD